MIKKQQERDANILEEGGWFGGDVRERGREREGWGRDGERWREREGGRERWGRDGEREGGKKGEERKRERERRSRKTRGALMIAQENCI